MVGLDDIWFQKDICHAHRAAREYLYQTFDGSGVGRTDSIKRLARHVLGSAESLRSLV